MIFRQKNIRVRLFWREKLFFFVFLSFFVFANNVFAADLGQEENFLVDNSYDYSDRSNVDAFLMYESKNAYFYFEKSYYDDLTAMQKQNIISRVITLGQEFDDVIYPETRKIFGQEWSPGIDGDLKLYILFSKMDYGIGGYFNPNDEYRVDNVLSGNSNEREMIYVNPDFLSSGKLEGFIAHEFQHMVYWNEKTRISGITDDTWINEARSELASSIIEDDLDKNFNETVLSSRKRDFVTKYMDSIVDWNNTNDDYVSVNIFMQYIKDHFSTDIFREMNSTKKVGANDLDYVLKKDGNIGLDKVFTNWTIANYVNDFSSNKLYGYEDENLEDLKVTPVIPIPSYDSDGNMTVKLASQLKNWSSNYYKVDLSKWKDDQIYIEVVFGGDNSGSFSLPYVVNYSNGSKQIDYVQLDDKQYGTRYMIFGGGTVDSIIFIPSNHNLDEALSSNQVKNNSFSMIVKAGPAGNKVYSDGTLVKTEGDGRIYLIEDGKRRWITDESAFESRGYDWKNIITISKDEMNLYPLGDDIKNEINPALDNSLVKGSSFKIYLIENNKKRWVKDEATFVSCGFDWKNVIAISDQELSRFADGEDLSRSVFADGALIKGTDPKVYLISGGKKRWITSVKAFNKNKFKWSDILETSDSIVFSYASGPNID